MSQWLQRFVARAVVPVFGLLGDSLLTTPRVDQTRPVQTLWAGSLVVANTCLALLVLVGGYTILSNPTVHTRYAVKEIAPRLVLGVVLGNVSLLLVGKAITFANTLAAALLGAGVDTSDATDSLHRLVVGSLTGDLGVFLSWVALVAVLMVAVLGLVYLVRMTVTVALIAVAPLALACHCLPQTEALARLWWRAFAGVLAIQVAQALVVVAAVRVFLHTHWYTDLLFPGGERIADLWIAVCLLYVLLRIPAWISRWIWRGMVPATPVQLTVRGVTAWWARHRSHHTTARTTSPRQLNGGRQ